MLVKGWYDECLADIKGSGGQQMGTRGEGGFELPTPDRLFGRPQENILGAEYADKGGPV